MNLLATGLCHKTLNPTSVLMKRSTLSSYQPRSIKHLLLVAGLSFITGLLSPNRPQARMPAERPIDSVPSRSWFELFKQTFQEWNNDGAPRLGAALAFYSMLSIGPLLLIVIAVGGLVFGHDRSSAFMIGEMRTLLGPDGAGAIEDILKHSQSETKNLIATAIGVGTLVISATGFFGQLQDAFNIIWAVPKTKSSIFDFLKKRLLSFGMIAGICMLLMFSLVVSAGLSAFTGTFSNYAPSIVAQVASVIVSFLVTTLLFAMAFKFLPDLHIRWSDVWFGAAITALLFTVGKSLIGLYLGRSALSSTYGAAGSMIVLLVWIYYSAQIVFFGAEFTKVHAYSIDGRPRPVTPTEVS